MELSIACFALFFMLIHVKFLFIMLFLVQFVLASLAMWGCIVYGGLKAFGGGKKEVKTEVFISTKPCTIFLFIVLHSTRKF
jgi:hypothetical protein